MAENRIKKFRAEKEILKDQENKISEIIDAKQSNIRPFHVVFRTDPKTRFWYTWLRCTRHTGFQISL